MSRRYGKHYINRNNYKHEKTKDAYNFKSRETKYIEMRIPPNLDMLEVRDLIKKYEKEINGKIPFTADEITRLRAKIVPHSLDTQVVMDANGYSMHFLAKEKDVLGMFGNCTNLTDLQSFCTSAVYGQSVLPIVRDIFDPNNLNINRKQLIAGAAMKTIVPHLPSKLEIGTKSTYY